MGAGLNRNPVAFRRSPIGVPLAHPPAPLYLPCPYAMPGGAFTLHPSPFTLAIRQAFPWGKWQLINFRHYPSCEAHYGNYGITYQASITCAPLPSLLRGVTSRSVDSSLGPFSDGSLAIPTHTAAAPPPVSLCCALICFSSKFMRRSDSKTAVARASERVPSCSSSRKSCNSFSSSLCNRSN